MAGSLVHSPLFFPISILPPLPCAYYCSQEEQILSNWRSPSFKKTNSAVYMKKNQISNLLSSDTNIPALIKLKKPLNLKEESPHTFSLCFQRNETPFFYKDLLEKVYRYCKSFDEGTPAARENVWRKFSQLVGTDLPRNEGCFFGPFLSWWILQPSFGWFGLELLYVSFVNVTSGSGMRNTTGKDLWDTGLSSVLFQLRLLQHWESKLSKLSHAHKSMIWKTCSIIPNFKENPASSFEDIFNRWEADPIKHLNSITIFFGALGYLKEQGHLKNELCYPKSHSSVFPLTNKQNPICFSTQTQGSESNLNSQPKPKATQSSLVSFGPNPSLSKTSQKRQRSNSTSEEPEGGKRVKSAMSIDKLLS